MSDELVKRHVEQLRMTGGDLADLCQPLADAIEYLIAERDVADALIEAQAKDHASNNIRFAEAEHRAEAAEAERDRLREALEYILAECTLSDNTMPSVGAIKYAARVALRVFNGK